MFNFTTQTVYNSISTTGANKNMWVVEQNSTKKPALRIGNTRFDADDILDLQIKNPTVENLASVTFDMSKLTLNEDENEATGRIVLYIGLSMNSQDSFYANDLVYKGKPLFIEFAVKKNEEASVVAKRVKANADKYFLFVTEEKILDVTVDGNNVTFTGVNGYQQIKLAVLQKFDPNAKPIDCCTNDGEFVDIIKGVPVIYTTDANGVVTTTTNKLGEDGQPTALANNEVAIAPGIEAFCDYNWIIHNLRLPTLANTNFWAPTKTEMPAVGQVYTQFIIRLSKERDGIAGEVVGQRATSVTTHVLYVAGKVSDNNSPAKLVDTELRKLIQTVKTDADDVLQSPFGEQEEQNEPENP